MFASLRVKASRAGASSMPNSMQNHLSAAWESSHLFRSKSWGYARLPQSEEVGQDRNLVF